MATYGPGPSRTAAAPPAAPSVVGAPPGLLRRVSWGAIFAGSVITLALQTLFVLFGFAWGFDTIDPARDADPLAGMATATGIYWIVTSVIAVGVGGYVGGRAAGIPKLLSGLLHGVAVWAVTTLVMIVLATSTGSRVVSGTYNAVSGSIGAATDAVGSLLPSDVSLPNLPEIDREDLPAEVRNALEEQDLTIEDLRAEAQEIFRSVVSRQEQQRIGQELEQTAADIVRSPMDALGELSELQDELIGAGGVLGEEDRQEALQVMEERLGITPEEAERILDRWQRRLEQAAQEVEQAWEETQQAALEAAETATNTLSTTAFWVALTSLLGLAAGAACGAFGRPSHALVAERY